LTIQISGHFTTPLKQKPKKEHQPKCGKEHQNIKKYTNFDYKYKFLYKKKYKFRLSIKKLLPSKTKTQKFINSMVFVN
jgi:hypothetical protein